MQPAIAPHEPNTATSPGHEEGESRLLIESLDWSGYKRLLKLFGDHGPRVYYLEGVVELMTVGPVHEQFSQILNVMISILTIELDIPCKAQGSTTIKRRRRQRGFEADQCYYLASLGLLRGQDLSRLKPFPRPDLAIEVEITSPLLDKLEIYAGLGVPEIWRHNRDGLTILCLGPDGQYAPASQSLAFPFLPTDGFRQQLATYDPDSETAWFRSYRDWVREVVAPLYHP